MLFWHKKVRKGVSTRAKIRSNPDDCSCEFRPVLRGISCALSSAAWAACVDAFFLWQAPAETMLEDRGGIRGDGGANRPMGQECRQGLMDDGVGVGNMRGARC